MIDPANEQMFKVELANEFNNAGYVVARGLLSPDLVESIKQWAGDTLAANSRSLGLSGTVARDEAEALALCLHQIHKIDDRFTEVARHPDLVEYLQTFIGQNIKMVQTQMFYKAPGMPGNNWHQDEIAIPTRDRSLLAAWVALDPADVENGCLRVIPGSHSSGFLYPRGPHGQGGRFDFPDRSFGFDEDNEVCLEVDPGDVVFFSGYLLHASTPNVSSRYRRALTIHYMNSYSLLPWRIVAESAGQIIRPALADYRDVVIVSGNDPYASVGYSNESVAHLRNWERK